MRVTRDVVLPVSSDEAWRLLTDPDELATWLGTPVDLDMAPGGAATLVEFDGTVRHAVIESIEAERHLGFVWWTEDEGVATTVQFELETVEAGTRVVVTEQARASVAGGIRRLPVGAMWSDRLFDLEFTVLSRTACLVGA
jgi:uncharacterized protein YndB with AHSA1/START domain